MDNVSVLVIEDKDDDRTIIERALTAEGYNVVCTPTGAEGLKLLRKNTYNVIVSELYMADLNGAELTSFVMESNPYVGIIMLTTSSFAAQAVDVLEHGAYAYLTKPLNPREIVLQVKRAYERVLLLSAGSQHDELTEMSVKDPLTGVFNRRFMNLFLKRREEKIRSTGKSFAVVMCDVDHFKKFNDTYGHQAGDRILKDMCQILMEAIRDSDAVFRYGGEEFLIFLDNVSKAEAASVAERIRSTAGLYLPATLSMGLASYPDDSTDVDDLVQKADASLYFSKENGRNRLTVAGNEGSQHL